MTGGRGGLRWLMPPARAGPAQAAGRLDPRVGAGRLPGGQGCQRRAAPREAPAAGWPGRSCPSAGRAGPRRTGAPGRVTSTRRRICVPRTAGPFSPRSHVPDDGMRGRRATSRSAEEGAWPMSSRRCELAADCAAAIGSSVLVYLATPAIWPGGWRMPVPDGRELVAAATGEPEPAATVKPRTGMAGQPGAALGGPRRVGVPAGVRRRRRPARRGRGTWHGVAWTGRDRMNRICCAPPGSAWC